MTWQTVPFNDFAGLDLKSSADNSPCIDLLNVDLDRRGSVRTRDGLEVWTFAPLTNYTRQLHAAGSYLIAGCSTRLETLMTGGQSHSSDTVPANDWTFVNFGSPSTPATYAGSTSDVRKFTTSWAGATATVDGVAGRTMPYFTAGAVQASDNRLVVMAPSSGPNGAVTSGSHVWFSAGGDAETWDTTDFEILTPGDYESITKIVAWQNLVFVFKKTKFFVFYGNSVDQQGGSVFNYRTVEGQGAVLDAVAGTDGVYFANKRGVFRTTGGSPQLVSSAIDPFFIGGESEFYTGDVADWASLNTAAWQLAWHDERLYMRGTVGGVGYSNRMFVYDQGQWTLWSGAFGAMASYWDPAEDYPALFVSYQNSGTSKDILRFTRGVTDDNGTAIVSRYRTGFYDLGVNSEKRASEMTVWGTGTVNLKMSRDFGSLDTARSMTLGTSPAIDRATKKCGKDGLVFSHEFSASSGAWAVQRAQLELEGARPPGAKTP